jgi:RNA polymerase sigma-70 factor (ECF subfamily)
MPSLSDSASYRDSLASSPDDVGILRRRNTVQSIVHIEAISVLVPSVRRLSAWQNASGELPQCRTEQRPLKAGRAVHGRILNFFAVAQSLRVREPVDPIEQALHRTLVARCQLGDHQALEDLFLRHNRRVAYYLRRMLGRDDVEDVQHEVRLTVIRRIGRLRSPDAFVVWLYQIARNKALNRLAQRGEVLSLDAEHAAEDAPDKQEPEFSPADAARIHEGLAQLNPSHREVLVLRFMENLSYEQIAELMNCNTGTVRSRLHYAKRALLHQLEKPS